MRCCRRAWRCKAKKVFKTLLFYLLQHVSHLPKEVLEREKPRCYSCLLIHLPAVRNWLVPELSVQHPGRAGTSLIRSSLLLQAPVLKRFKSNLNRSLFWCREWEVFLPWAQKPQAQCSTGSSNLWKPNINKKTRRAEFSSLTQTEWPLPTWRWGNLRTSAGWPGRGTWGRPNRAKQHSCRSKV